ncbi:hypothetical protein [Amycolatopsis saalfeldensis]|uniref:DUF5666 domain-containing protein n=1 Tax=Amycolatopsis saalfeldensis TaxID=394193 RepID=A0A1H8YLF6_9PSEU|nr:hypothetical protein [Amycolatopsis saalfeldensis]SEP52979.1 hypothetical protein SAMN04489732_123106 [Amycolatopsis saalfeldensis]
MTTEPTDPAQGPTWGAAPGTPGAAVPPQKKAWSGRKTAIAAGVAVVIAVGGGLAIWAGTSSNGASAQQGFGGPGGPGGTGGPGGFAGRAGGFGGGAAALRDALHGDFVVADPTGGYVTERLQTGDVSALSATSVTLTSKDGYKQTYAIDSSTQKTGNVKTGDNVTVVAKVSGTTATATTLGEATTLQPGGQGQYGQPGQGRRRYGS